MCYKESIDIFIQTVGTQSNMITLHGNLQIASSIQRCRKLRLKIIEIVKIMFLFYIDNE